MHLAVADVMEQYNRTAFAAFQLGDQMMQALRHILGDRAQAQRAGRNVLVIGHLCAFLWCHLRCNMAVGSAFSSRYLICARLILARNSVSKDAMRSFVKINLEHSPRAVQVRP